jgi:hypothetical protein
MPITAENFSPENLHTLATQLHDHADEEAWSFRHDLAADLRSAARVTARFVEVQQRIGEIAADILGRPNWDAAVFYRDLRELIEKENE